MHSTKQETLATFKVRDDEKTWRCGCGGRLATVVVVGGKTGLALPMGYRRRNNGIWAKSARAESRSERAASTRILASAALFTDEEEFAEAFLSSPGTDSGTHTQQIQAILDNARTFARSRDQVDAEYLWPEDFNVSSHKVCCPGCRNLCIISSVNGIPADH
jgi:hypothetical protein